MDLPCLTPFNLPWASDHPSAPATVVMGKKGEKVPTTKPLPRSNPSKQILCQDHLQTAGFPSKAKAQWILAQCWLQKAGNLGVSSPAHKHAVLGREFVALGGLSMGPLRSMPEDNPCLSGFSLPSSFVGMLSGKLCSQKAQIRRMSPWTQLFNSSPYHSPAGAPRLNLAMFAFPN